MVKNYIEQKFQREAFTSAGSRIAFYVDEWLDGNIMNAIHIIVSNIKVNVFTRITVAP